jgi:SAM-dependent methyltransferase
MTESIVKEFYTSSVRKEWRRLIWDAYHRLEFETTLHFLEKYLPAKGLILDAGGGPGRYTLELARRGYQVVLLDMTPANLELPGGRSSAPIYLIRSRMWLRVRLWIYRNLQTIALTPSYAWEVLCLTF